MLRSSASGAGRTRRAGQVLVLVALLLPPLCGMIGLVIDVGVLLAARRQAQNAADSAARVAALERLAGKSDGEALAAAETSVRSYNQLPAAAVVLNSPPLAGGYAGNPDYVEAVVSVESEAWFMPVVGGERRPTVTARAVAGPESKAAVEALCLLDPTAAPGLTVERVGLQVNGRVWVNSEGAGSDEAGGWVALGSAAYAVRRLNGGSFRADRLRTVGGADSAAGYVTADGASCLKARQLPRSDPLLNLPTPTTATGVLPAYPGPNGQTFASPQHVVVDLAAAQTATFAPGIYGSIVVTGAGSVEFQAGIYVLRGGNPDGRALSVATTGAVTGTGVMFYNTGSTYDSATGGPDSADGNAPGTDPAATFGDVTLDAGMVTLSPLSGTSSPFAGLILYQRRRNPAPITVPLNASGGTMTGTVYARRAKLTLLNPGTFTAQIVTGSFAATSPTSGGSLVIDPSAAKGRAKLVYLVE